MNNFTEGTIRYKPIVFFCLTLLIALGIWGLLTIKRDEFPALSVGAGLVVGVYPGADAREVEQQLTKPLEDMIFNMPEVEKNSTSVSKDGFTFLTVRSNVSPEQSQVLWNRIRVNIDKLKLTLPPGVLTIQVIDEFGSVSSMLLAMSSEDRSYSEMKTYAHDLCKELGNIPSLARTTVLGEQEEEIAVHVDMDRLTAYGVSPASIALDFFTSTVAASSGSANTGYSNSLVHFSPTITNETELAEKVVYADPDGRVIRLKDIAQIERRYAAPTAAIAYNGHPTLVVSIEMKEGNNISAFGEEVEKVLAGFKEKIPESVSIEKITDQPKVVTHSISSFLRDLFISMLVVILVMMLLFPAGSALIASSGVPICTIVTIGIVWFLGMELNTVSLAALIVVLGMIVDDAIITMDGYMEHLGRGLSPMEAAKASSSELFMPMLLSTASISLMFFPMLFTLKGTFGAFVRSFPFIIGIALLASLLYALIVVPSLETAFIKSAKPRETAFSRLQNKLFTALQTGYEEVLEQVFKHPWISVVGGILAVAVSLYILICLNIQLLPKAQRENFVVEVYLDEGSSLEKTRHLCDSLQRILLQDKRIKSVTAFMGTGAPRFHATFAPKIPGPNFAQFIVNTKSIEATNELVREYEEKYENWFPSAQIHIKQMDYQVVDAPIMVQFSGRSTEELMPYADSLVTFMRENISDHLSWIHTTCDEFRPVVQVDMKDDVAARMGVNRGVSAISLAGLFHGSSIAGIWEEGRQIPVRLYSRKAGDGSDYEEIANQLMASAFPGVSVPLRQVADIVPAWEPEVVTHVGGKETLIVMADVKYRKSQPTAIAKIGLHIYQDMQIPDDVEVYFGGLSELNRTSTPDFIITFLMAVMVLFFFLLFHFKKISVSVLTIALSGLGLFGGFLGLWIFKLDLGITALLGLISLIGIIVRNGILMFEYAEELRSQGMSVADAAKEAGKRRMRPIFLTSCTTALGVVPMVVANDPLWTPMGVTICIGIMISIWFVVFIMPSSYSLVFKNAKNEKTAD